MTILETLIIAILSGMFAAAMKKLEQLDARLDSLERFLIRHSPPSQD